MEKCLADYEKTNNLGFLVNPDANLIEYWYGSLSNKTIHVPPFISKSSITITQIQDYICNNKILI